jgi:hypothetical protein
VWLFFQVTKFCDLGPYDGVCCPVDQGGLFHIHWYKPWSSSGTLLGYSNLFAFIINVFESWELRIMRAYLPCRNRFGMVLNARRSEQWQVIKQEPVCWHGIHAYWLLGVGIGTYFNMIWEFQVTLLASFLVTSLG